MTPPPLSLPAAERLAERIRAAIDEWDVMSNEHADGDRADADRERVASDLAGLREHVPTPEYTEPWCENDAKSWPCPDARRYWDGLTRTAALYGVTDA